MTRRGLPLESSSTRWALQINVSFSLDLLVYFDRNVGSYLILQAFFDGGAIEIDADRTLIFTVECRLRGSWVVVILLVFFFSGRNSVDRRPLPPQSIDVDWPSSFWSIDGRLIYSDDPRIDRVSAL